MSGEQHRLCFPDCHFFKKIALRQELSLKSLSSHGQTRQAQMAFEAFMTTWLQDRSGAAEKLFAFLVFLLVDLVLESEFPEGTHGSYY